MKTLLQIINTDNEPNILMEENHKETYPNRTMVNQSKKRSVFIVYGQNLLLHGCFDTKEKAEKYANGSANMNIKKIRVD